MANLRSIKDRINSIKNTQKITRAMKMVAAAKVKKAEAMTKASRPFTLELYKMFCWVYKEAMKNMTPNIVFSFKSIKGDFIVVNIDEAEREFESLSAKDVTWYASDLINKSFLKRGKNNNE